MSIFRPLIEIFIYTVLSKLFPTLGNFALDLNFTLRNSGRRVVMGLVVDHELEMMEIRVRQLYKLVDVFVILESNVTEGIQRQIL